MATARPPLVCRGWGCPGARPSSFPSCSRCWELLLLCPSGNCSSLAAQLLQEPLQDSTGAMCREGFCSVCAPHLWKQGVSSALGVLCAAWGQHSSAGSPSPHRQLISQELLLLWNILVCSSWLEQELVSHAGGCCPLQVDVVPGSWEVSGISQLPSAGFLSSIIPLNLGAGRRILMTLSHSEPSVSSVLSCSPLQHELLSSLAASHLIPKPPGAHPPCVDRNVSLSW